MYARVTRKAKPRATAEAERMVRRADLTVLKDGFRIKSRIMSENIVAPANPPLNTLTEPVPSMGNRFVKSL